MAERPAHHDADDLAALHRVWDRPPGIYGWLGVVNHKAVGLRYMATAFAFFLAGGVAALFMRTQLAVPENDFLPPDVYNELFTMHGTTMMFLFAVPMAEGFAAYIVPLMIGAREMAFPRLNAFGYWCFLLGGLFLYASFLVGSVADAGWFAYVPLSGPLFSPGMGMDYWLLGITFVEVSALVAATELIVSILRLRAPGMSLHRMPVFVWAILAIAVAIVFAFPPLIAGGIMLELDRAIGTQFFNPEAGGSALLWQHLFWIFGHPEVYIQFLPAAGIISMVVPTFAGRSIAGYVFVVFAVLATAVLGFGLWVHHMYATGIPALALAFFTATSLTIAVPSGIQVFAWIGTLWGSRPRITTPLLWALGTIVTFVLGGVTGVMVGLVPLDWQVHDTFFVVAHFHYVLIGGVVFPVFAGLYYWFPKITGRVLSETMGRWNFWLVFLGFHVTFLPMHAVGIMGMPRRVYTYPDGLGWETLNLVQTAGAYMIAAGVLVFLVNTWFSLRAGHEAGHNPWRGGTLEWSVPSPPPPYNFARNAVVAHRDPLWVEPSAEERAEYADLLTPDVHHRRETLVTSVMDARPEAIIWLPASSLAPLLAALAAGAFFVGALAKLPLLMLAGLIAVVAVAAVWAWPDARTRRARVTGERAPAGLAFELGGRNTLDWWGTFVFVLVFGSLVGAFVGGYFYLVAEGNGWPPEGFEAPDLLLPALAGGAAALAPLTMLAARASARRGGRAGVVVAVLAATALGVAFIALVAIDQRDAGFSPDEHAYASLYFLLGWLAMAHVAVAMLLGLLVLARWVLLPGLEEWHLAWFENALLGWAFAAAVGVISVAVVYGAPHVL